MPDRSHGMFSCSADEMTTSGSPDIASAGRLSNARRIHRQPNAALAGRTSRRVFLRRIDGRFQVADRRGTDQQGIAEMTTVGQVHFGFA